METNAITTQHRYGGRLLDTEPATGLPDSLVRITGESCEREDMRGLSCDHEGCFEPDWTDILAGTSDELRPMYLDLRDEVVICQRCVDAGRHLED